VTIVLALASAITIAACGTTGQTPTSTRGLDTYTVKVRESFPSDQRLSETSQLVVDVTNTGTATLPNVAVTLTDVRHPEGRRPPGETRLASSDSAPPLLTDGSEPIWTIHRAPGPCGRNCQNLGPGPTTASSTRTWALGHLKPGKTMKFDWHVSAVQAGSFTISYSVAADVAAGVKTLLANGAPATGEFTVKISGSKPRSAAISGSKPRSAAKSQ